MIADKYIDFASIPELEFKWEPMSKLPETSQDYWVSVFHPSANGVCPEIVWFDADYGEWDTEQFKYDSYPLAWSQLVLPTPWTGPFTKMGQDDDEENQL